LLRQLPDLNEIIRRLTVNRDRYSFNRNIFLATAIVDQNLIPIDSNIERFWRQNPFRIFLTVKKQRTNNIVAESKWILHDSSIGLSFKVYHKLHSYI